MPLQRRTRCLYLIQKRKDLSRVVKSRIKVKTIHCFLREITRISRIDTAIVLIGVLMIAALSGRIFSDRRIFLSH